MQNLTKWVKGWAAKILLFASAILLLWLTSSIFDSLGLIEPETYGSDPVDLMWQIFWAIAVIVGGISMLIFLFTVVKEWIKKSK